MKEIKREYLPLYSYYDRSGIAAHLEKMAAKGWLLEKLGGWCWTYRKIEPKQLRFTVTYFPDAGAFSPLPSEGQATYWEFCGDAGWTLAAESAQVQIFYTEDENAVPIETDPEVELQTMQHTMKKSALSAYRFLLILSLVQIGFAIWRIWNDPVGQLSNPTMLVSATGYLPLLLLVSVELLRCRRWFRRAREAVEAGRPLPDLRSARKLSLFVILFAAGELLLVLLTSAKIARGTLLLMVAMFFYILLMTYLSSSARDAMKHLRFKAWVNKAISYGIIIVMTVAMMTGMVAIILHTDLMETDPPPETYEYKGMTWDIYHDTLPLSVEDLADTDYTGWSKRLKEQSSPLLTHVEAIQRPRMDALNQPDLEYELVIVKWDPLYDLCKNKYIRWVERWNKKVPERYREEYRPVDAAPWGAAEAYQRYNSGEPSNQFLICWGDRMAEISFDWDWTITEEMMAITAAALNDVQTGTPPLYALPGYVRSGLQ